MRLFRRPKNMRHWVMETDHGPPRETMTVEQFMRRQLSADDFARFVFMWRLQANSMRSLAAAFREDWPAITYQTGIADELETVAGMVHEALDDAESMVSDD